VLYQVPLSGCARRAWGAIRRVRRDRRSTHQGGSGNYEKSNAKSAKHTYGTTPRLAPTIIQYPPEHTGNFRDAAATQKLPIGKMPGTVREVSFASRERPASGREKSPGPRPGWVRAPGGLPACGWSHGTGPRRLDASSRWRLTRPGSRTGGPGTGLWRPCWYGRAAPMVPILFQRPDARIFGTHADNHSNSGAQDVSTAVQTGVRVVVQRRRVPVRNSL
jgi:hypothetical protein